MTNLIARRMAKQLDKLARTSLMSTASVFSDVFSSAEPHVYDPTLRPGYTMFGPENRHRTTGYCEQSEVGSDAYHNALHVQLTAATAEIVSGNMLALDRDEIHFEIIRFADGYAHVHARYSNIIGGRLLAVIRTSSIPEFGE